jgi:aminoglycoside phosphotransferase (APT) family kinase protein
MHELTTKRAQYIVETAAPGYQLVTVKPAFGTFTNDAQILECRTPGGGHERLVVKFLVDEPDSASECAVAHFHALGLARAHGIPAPEPVYLDETGRVLGVPGIVTRFVEGRQVADPHDPVTWAETLADLLLGIHAIHPGDEDRRHLIDGNHEALFFLRGDWPEKKGGHPLSTDIFDAVRELQPDIVRVPAVLVHLDYWHGNVLWHEGRVSAVVDWDHASYGDQALDVAYFRMNMYLRGIKAAADIFLRRYEEGCGGAVPNLGFWEVAAAARPLPEPVLWGVWGATDERASNDYYEFVSKRSFEN